MAIANYYEQKPLIIFTFKKLCNGEQRLAAQQLLFEGSIVEAKNMVRWSIVCIFS